jgi:GNAT superfamily N-acetyltransferase
LEQDSILKPVLSDADITSVTKLASIIWKEHYTPIIGAEQVLFMLDKFQSKEAIRKQIKNEFLYFLLIVHEPIGYLSIKYEEQTLFLSKVYITAENRGKGYGLALIHHAEQMAQLHHVSSLRLTVNKYNTKTIAAYERMGFVKKREIIFDIGNGYIMDDYEMIKILKHRHN